MNVLSSLIDDDPYARSINAALALTSLLRFPTIVTLDTTSFIRFENFTANPMQLKYISMKYVLHYFTTALKLHLFFLKKKT